MREIELLIIHCSGTRVDRDITASDIHSAHRMRGYSSGGYHYFIRKSGQVEPMRPLQEPGAHARGYNRNSVGVCYEGGLDVNGNAADTRTLQQKVSLVRVIGELKAKFPDICVKGHRDLSPDKNYNGIIDPWERITECPCFEVKEEFK